MNNGGLQELVANEASRARSNPAVSVLITLYNYSAYITSCLDSVRASKAENLPGGFDVLVVDDGSTDNSVQVVEQYLKTHDLPICLVKKGRNTGLADSRNTGLQMARAPLVFILDADNEIQPECLAAHYATMVGSDYALAYSHINRFSHVTRQSLGLMSDQEWDVRRLVSSSCIDAMAMVRKEAVLRVGGYSTEYGTVLPQGWEDYDLWLKLAQAGYCGKMIPQVLSDYRVHEQSMVHGTKNSRLKFAQYFLKKFCFLAQQYADTDSLFGFSRRELAIAEQLGRFQTRPKSWDQKIIHQLLGRKMSRSLCKRLAAVYSWLYP